MGASPASSLEEQIVNWLTAQFAGGEHVRLPIGDDACWLDLGNQASCVVTTDMLLEGVHFVGGADLSWEQAGGKAIGVNLSDLAAMAARPVAVFVSLSLPRRATLDDVKRLYAGMRHQCDRYRVAMAGGDTNVWEGGLAVSVTAVGLPVHDLVWTRSGGQAGDALLVTGALGGSRLGRHWCEQPRVELAMRLAEQQIPVHAAMDISDGLALDLSRLARASGCGARVFESEIPIADAALALSAAGSGKTPLQHALSDGEDFELLLALPPEAVSDARRAAGPDQPLFEIGVLTADQALVIETAEGDRRGLPPVGYLHGG